MTNTKVRALRWANSCVVKDLTQRQGVAGSNPETTEFLTNSSGQATY